MSVEPKSVTPAFEQWFKGSKVVDADGKPLVVYHGTANSFKAFAAHSYTERQGFYFTSEPEFASDFAETSADGVRYDKNEDAQGPNVMPVYLSLQNPVDTRSGWPAKVAKQLEDVINTEWLTTLPQSDFWLAMDGDDGAAIKSKLESLGYDGLIATEVGVPVYVAFKPAQIKSATGNNGNFDAASPDIRFSTPEQPNQTSVQTPTQTPNQPDHRLGKKIMTSATSDVNVTMSFRQVSSVGGKKAQYVFDIYRLDPPLKKPEDMKRTVVGSVVYYAGLEEPVLTQFYPSVCQLDRDRIISVARPGSSGGVCGGALKWSPVGSDADGAEDEPDSSTADSGTGAPCP